MLERYFRPDPVPESDPIFQAIQSVVSTLAIDPGNCRSYFNALENMSSIVGSIDERDFSEHESLAQEWMNGHRKVEALHRDSCRDFNSLHERS